MPFKDREAERAYKAKRHAENREKNLEKMRAYYRKNKAKLNAQSRAWNVANREYLREYRRKNRERKRLNNIAWRRANPEKIRDIKRAWNKANADKVRIYRKRYRQKYGKRDYLRYVKPFQKANPEKMRGYYRTYYKRKKERDPDFHRIQRANRRARIEAQGGRLPYGTVPRLMKSQDGLCNLCKCDLAKSKYHVDHIKPLSRGGLNAPENVQLLCPPCNLSKAAT